LIPKGVDATLAEMMGEVKTRPPLPLGRALVGAAVVVLAACASETGNTSKSTRPTAPTTTAAPTTTMPPAMPYAVRRGDTLTSIAKFFGISTAAVLAANPGINADRLTEGQVLQIPPTPPPQLVITPTDAPAGETFKFNVNGAKAGEVVLFEIDIPGGRKFTGQPHTASQDGIVSASYQTDSGNDAGTYTVVANGDRGTSLRATFRILG
jgi:LysM repeat protein